MSGILRASNLSFRYPGTTRKALEDITFESGSGQVIALLGPNGCGKSTLLRLIAGILPIPGGDVEGTLHLDGQELARQSLPWRARRIAYAGSELRTEFPLSAWDAVMLGRMALGTGLFHAQSRADRDRVRKAMERALCWTLRDRDIARLSGGERQLVGMARTLAREARTLLLDESLSQMDLDHQARMGRLLRELASEGHRVILVSHDLNLASEWADYCLLLREGRLIASGALRETLTEEMLLTLYPDTDLFLAPNPRTGAPKVFFGSGISN